jgi:hypothetical protein
MPKLRWERHIDRHAKNLFTPIALAHQMIDSSLVLDSQLARHRQLFDPIINLCSIVGTDPISDAFSAPNNVLRLHI